MARGYLSSEDAPAYRHTCFRIHPLYEVLHTRCAATSLASVREIASPWTEATMLIKVQRAGIVGIAVVVAIGLLWSVAVMSSGSP